VPALQAKPLVQTPIPPKKEKKIQLRKTKLRNKQQQNPSKKHSDSGNLEEINAWSLLPRTLADTTCLLPSI
jgi:hypothetical protein